MIAQEELKNHIVYNPETGELHRICRTHYHLRPITYTNKSGYITFRLKKQTYLGHRVAWLYMTDKWPDKFIDHINHNPADNRWCNLREATYTENNRNKRFSKNNTSGYKGVSWKKSHNKWRAEIRVDGVGKHLGYYETPEAAFEAYCSASRRFHGEFGCAA